MDSEGEGGERSVNQVDLHRGNNSDILITLKKHTTTTTTKNDAYYSRKCSEILLAFITAAIMKYRERKNMDRKEEL